MADFQVETYTSFLVAQAKYSSIKRFLGRQVSPDEFINNPKLQEKFIESEINLLLNKSYTLPQIFAAHRSGWSDFGEKQEKVYNRKKYVDSAINHYIKVLSKS